jgi:trimeric autotransporter adhesin
MRKRVLFLLVILFTSTLGLAQLTGIKTIPGDYASVAAAITALNTSGVGIGGVTFNIAAGYAETFSSPTAGYITTNTGTAANQIIFQKSGSGANPVITAGIGTGTMDAIICFNGVKYITFDGINLTESVGNVTTTTQMEWGFALLKASATQGSQNITIKNSSITLKNTNTATYGIYSNNHSTAATTQLTVTATAGQNSNNKFYGNTITNSYGGIYLSGFADATAPYAYYDQGNDIGSVTGNTINNFGGGATVEYLIYAIYQNNLIIANSNISGTGTGTASIYGIYGGTSTNATASIYGNNVSIVQSVATTGYIYAIYNTGLGTGGTTNTLAIYNNTVQNCLAPASTTSYFYGIYNSATAFTCNFYGNTVTNNVFGGSNYMYLCYTSEATGGIANVYNNTISNNQRSGAGTQSASAYLYCLYVTGSGNTSIHDNNIFGNSCPAQTTKSAFIYGLYCSNSATSQMIYNNTIHDLTVTSSYTAGNAVYGIYAYPAAAGAATNALYNNTVYNLTITNSGTGGYGYIYGIYGYYMGNIYGNSLYNVSATTSSTGYGYGYGYYVGGAGTFKVYKNKLYNITMGGASGYYYGLYITGPTLANIYNNYISDLKTPASTSTSALHGIYVNSATTANFYYNTVYLNCTNTSASTFQSNAIYVATATTCELRNNIFVNLSTSTGTTVFNTAYRRSSATLTTYAATSNNNDFYAGTPSAQNLIMYDGTNSYQTLAAYKTAVAPRDASSITELPPFVNVATTPYDLHIKTTIATQCESGGSVVSTPEINVDYDNTPRYPNPGYPVGASTPSAPDIGANEFGGILLDITPPAIVYAPLLNTNLLTARTLTTTITDASGVPTSGIGLPRLYWKVNAGTYSSVTGVSLGGGQYTFTFGTGVVLGDVISYYIVAQDGYSTPNVGSNPSTGASGFTYNPPAASTPPTTPNTYTIVSSICGTFNVGVGQTYATLTEAINDFNNKVITCPVTFLLTDAAYPSETYPIVIYANGGSSTTNTLTIKPGTGISPVLTGSVSAGPLIKNLNSNTIIDGSNTVGGITRDLTISNTSVTTPQVFVQGSTGTTPLVNCTLKNTIFINGINSSSGVIISDGTTPGNAGYFNNFTFENNSIQKSYIGLYLIANAAAGNGTGTLITGNDMSTSGTNAVRLCAIYIQGVDGATITNNTIGNFAATDAANITGIWAATATINTSISNNTITNIASTTGAPRGIVVSSGVSNANMTINGNNISTITTTYSSAPYGIYVFSTTTGVTVSNNKVGGLLNSNTGGYGARGIFVSTGMAASNVNLVNNIVYDIKCSSDASITYYCIGMGIDASTSGVNVYHNSVYLSGTYAGYSSATVSAAMYIGTPNTAINLRDNIFVNTYDNTGGSGDKSYAIYSAAANTAFTNINYNDYYVAGSPGVLGYLGADQATLTAWKTATTQDLNSINADPAFTSTTNLLPTNLTIGKQGTYLTTVPNDVTNATRTNPPDMGAYEFGTAPTVITLAATGLTSSGATLNGSINANTLTTNSFFDYGLTTAYGTSTAGVPASVTGSSATAISLPVAGLTPLTTYHYRARGVTTGGMIVYGADMTFTTSAPPPTITTGAATAITSGGATLNGTANANGASTVVSFQYGLTGAYGSTVTGTPATVTGSTITAFTGSITGLSPNTLYHYRAVGTNSGGTTYGADMTFTTSPVVATVTTLAASNITTNDAQLNGNVNANNATTTVSFDYGLTAAYGSNIAATPVTVSGTTVTSVLANLTGLAINTTYHFRCKGVNAAGTTYGNDMTFLTGCPPVGPAGPITGPVSICTNSTGNVYTVATITNATGYAWTVPAGAIITAGANTTSITVTFGAASGNVSVYGTGPCGNGSASNLPVTVNPLPLPTITGPATACQGYSGNVYTTQAGMTGYNWTVSTGGSITAGTGTNAITVTWTTSGAKTVTVTYTNANGCAAVTPGSYAVNVNAAPSPTITGPNNMCVNSGYYDYATESGMTGYVWNVSSGGTITWGAGTNQIQVTWNTAGAQSVTVNYNNATGCAAPSPTSYSVTVNPMPGTAGTITGTATVCGGAQGVAYSIAPVANAANYVWNLPSGATIATGFNTNSITVDFASNASSGNITAQGNNLCGNGLPSPPFAVTVTALPDAAGAITGQTVVCQGTVGVEYSVGAIANATSYTWTIPAGASIASGASTNSITVDYGMSAVSGNVTVAGTNSCGSGTLSPPFAVSVNPKPTTPIVSASGVTLTSNTPSGNQWYYSDTQSGTGNLIPGATGQTYDATQTGWYWSVVTITGCSSDPSNREYILMVGQEDLAAESFIVYPVPNDGKFTVSITTPVQQNFSIFVYNKLGQMVYEIRDVVIAGDYRQVIDLRPTPSGVYTVIFQNNDHAFVRKVLINK